MGHRLSKIYTRTGDEGYTSFNHERISKNDLAIEAVGNLDELNASIGLVIALSIQDEDILAALTRIQHDLFDLGGELHSPEHIAITADHITRLETWLDAWNAALPPLKEFLLPRGNASAAAMHVARTVCRRAERSVVALHRRVPLQNAIILPYINRLSDLLFVLARVLGQQENEILWNSHRHPS